MTDKHRSALRHTDIQTNNGDSCRRDANRGCTRVTRVEPRHVASRAFGVDAGADQAPACFDALAVVHRGHEGYPESVHRALGRKAPPCVFAIGNRSLLRFSSLALICSERCPGGLILKTYDLARTLRDAGVVVTSGFHSPMEKECLALLLRGRQPVILCPATRLPKRLSRPHLSSIAEGRLLVVSPFGDKVKRPSRQTAQVRNELVAALATQVFVAHAAPGSSTESLCRSVLKWKKPLFTFDAPENRNILTIGARGIASPSELIEILHQGQ